METIITRLKSNVVEIEITKCDITSVSSTNTSDRTILNIGDIVPVTLETKMTFGKTTEYVSLE